MQHIKSPLALPEDFSFRARLVRHFKAYKSTVSGEHFCNLWLVSQGSESRRTTRRGKDLIECDELVNASISKNDDYNCTCISSTSTSRSGPTITLFNLSRTINRGIFSTPRPAETVVLEPDKSLSDNYHHGSENARVLCLPWRKSSSTTITLTQRIAY